VTASHPTSGRATSVVRSVEDPLVIALTPPTFLTGRVLRATVPVAGARVRFVPQTSALLESDSPQDLVAEERTTGADGRFRLPLPPLHNGDVQIVAPGGSIVRLSLPPARAAATLDERSLGDITLPDPHRLTVRLLDADACQLTAAGPLGSLGLTIVRATPAANVHWFELPEAGEWALAADCAGTVHRLEPSIVRVTNVHDMTIEARLVK